jgi:hypothetical protein
VFYCESRNKQRAYPFLINPVSTQTLCHIRSILILSFHLLLVSHVVFVPPYFPFENKFIYIFNFVQETRGSVVVKTLCYKPEGLGFGTRCGEFLNVLTTHICIYCINLLTNNIRRINNLHHYPLHPPCNKQPTYLPTTSAL